MGAFRLKLLIVLCAIMVAGATFSAKDGEKDISITVSDSGVSLFAVNADAHDVLNTLARETGVPIIVDDTVDRKITLNLVDKTSREIITTIVDTYGLSFAEVDGIFIFSEGIPNSPSSYLLSDIGSYTTQYVSAGQARDLMPAFLTRYVKANAAQNAVVLSAPEPVLRRFKEDIEQFDKPPAQIMLDVLVVEFTDMDTETFAARLGWENDEFGLRTDSLTGDLNFTALADLSTNFFTFLDALVSARKARVKACPSIATVSGSSAEIFIGTQQFLEIPVQLPGAGQSNSIDAGVRLEMRPLTGGEGEIILRIEEEISTLGAISPITGLPEKTTRTADTTVRVQDGQTLIVGGLKQDESREVHRRIPLLSEIPVVGELFKSKDIEKTKIDLTIFVTARLLSQTGHLPAEQEEPIKERFIPEGEQTSPVPAAPGEVIDE